MMITPHQRSAAALLSTRTPKSSLQFQDSEFGTVNCRRSRTGRYVRIRLTPTGTLTATLPRGGRVEHVRQLIDSSREELRRLIREQGLSKPKYFDGQKIGQSHQLKIIQAGPGMRSSHKILGQVIVITLAIGIDPTSASAQDIMRIAVKDALKREARAYLPRRLRHLADTHGFTYEKIRYANQSGRWGSCSSSGTISLNIALMNLSLELIDYVLIHELCHTVHLHHQPDFWTLVESYSPGYKQLRKQLKTHNPHI